MAHAGSGNPCEAAVLSGFAGAGFDVLIPFGDGHPFDLVVVVNSSFIRVQCKTAWAKGGCLVFNSRSTDHGRGPLSYLGRADVFGIYFPPNQAVYLVPVGLPGTEGRLRLNLPRNNQRRRIRFASDYEFSTWTSERLGTLVASTPESEQVTPLKVVP